MALLAINWTAPLSSLAGTVTIGQCLVDDGGSSAPSGRYVVSTTANRGTKRSSGIAITTGDASNSVAMFVKGELAPAYTGLAAGVASPLRVSSSGALERVTTPTSSDDVVGYCEANGLAHLDFGPLTHRLYVDTGGGGGSTPTGTGFRHVTAGVEDAASAKVNLAAAADVTGTLPVGNGGTGITSFGAGVATFLGTPSGANLASALTSALPDTKGGTGLTSLGAGVATFLGTPSGANLASALTSALPTSKGGTGLTALAANMATFLGTATSANLAATVSDETGTGALVFGTQPTISTPLLDLGVRWTGVTSDNSTGTINNVSLASKRILAFTNAAGPTVTGIDATGISDGDEIIVYSTSGSFILNHQDAGSTATNRIDTGGVAMTIPAGPYIRLRYLSSRWHVPCGLAV